MKLRNIFALALVLSAVLTSCNKDKKRVEDFSYAFNTGQVVAAFAYDGTHADNLSVDLKLEGQKDGTMITVTINNSISGETYNVHAHDAADAGTTPNGTPYNETPNSGVFVQMIAGTGAAASATQVTTMTVTELTETYEGFLVIHDPLQDMSTTDPTTYVILGSFAR
ncbi:MAG: hypothetical protein GQ574_00935 [Crocinitomix sp.]|nr:hypothetical protein [Crocinitomix sp.]